MWSHRTRNITLPRWLRENRRIRTALLLATGLLLADLALYALLIAPAAANLSAGEAKYAELKKRRTEAVLFQKQKEELAGFMAGIPAQKDMPLIVKELVQAARRLHLSVSAINYDIPKRGGEELAMLTFSFPAEGRYGDVKRFIYEVETSDRLVGIQDMKLESAKGGRVKLDLKLMMYIKGK